MIEIPLSRYFGIGGTYGMTKPVLREYPLRSKPSYPYIEGKVFHSTEITWDFEYEGVKFSRVLLAHNSSAVFLFEGSYDPVFHPYLTYLYRIYTVPRDNLADNQITMSIVFDGPEDLELLFKLAHG